MAVGDFNIPSRQTGDAIFDALTPPEACNYHPHETRIPGTNLAGNREYDKVAFVPGLKRNIVEQGVFDLDGILFADIWDPNAPAYWRTCAKYYVSDTPLDIGVHGGGPNRCGLLASASFPGLGVKTGRKIP